MPRSTHIPEQQLPETGEPLQRPSRQAVLEQLERLLASRFFSNSKRSPAMLSYVVHQAMEGRAESLKERSLGIEVFHRAADYDNNSDPIVRLAAGDIRKRLAQYYCEPEHASELRVSLPAGSYVPEFHWPETAPVVHEPSPPAEVQAVIPAPPAALPNSRQLRPWTIAAASLAAVALAGLAVWFYAITHPASERFWTGVLDTRNPVLICVGQPDRFVGEASYKKYLDDTSLGDRLIHLDRLSMPDAIAVARLAGLLGSKQVSYSLQGEESTTFEDMRRGPAILVSGADNPWTLRATKDLRFHFENEVAGSSARVWIADRNNPGSRSWLVDFGMPYTALSQDYAIIGRFNNPTTGKPTVVAAGIGANGTLVASECLTDSKCLGGIVDRDPLRGRKNIEAVIGTQVIGGKTGPPNILAVHSW